MSHHQNMSTFSKVFLQAVIPYYMLDVASAFLHTLKKKNSDSLKMGKVIFVGFLFFVSFILGILHIKNTMLPLVLVADYVIPYSTGCSVCSLLINFQPTVANHLTHCQFFQPTRLKFTI